MKKFTTAFIIFFIAYFTFNGCIPRDRENENFDTQETEFSEQADLRLQLKAKTLFLTNEGWSEKAADHIARVELGLTSADELYEAYMED